MVRIWRHMLRLIQSIIAARVVLLPEPVGPVTRIIPLGRAASSLSTGGRFRSSMVAIFWGISRSTIAGPRNESNRLMRTRTKEKAWEPSNSFSRWKASISTGLSISLIQPLKVAASVTGQPVPAISPRARKRGSSPTPKCTSE